MQTETVTVRYNKPHRYSGRPEMICGENTGKARRSIKRWALRSRVLYWLDLGNNASSGPFILGQAISSANRKKKQRLPTV